MWKVEVEKLERDVHWKKTRERYEEKIEEEYRIDKILVKIYYNEKYVAAYKIEPREEWVSDWMFTMMDELNITVDELDRIFRNSDNKEELIRKLEKLIEDKRRR